MDLPLDSPWKVWSVQKPTKLHQKVMCLRYGSFERRQPAQPPVLHEPEGPTLSNGVPTLSLDCSASRMNPYYYDILANLEPSDPVVSATVNSIASEYFHQVFLPVAQQLNAQRSDFSAKMKDRQAGDDKSTQLLNMISEALSAMIVTWLKDLTQDFGALQTAVHAVSNVSDRRTSVGAQQRRERRGRRSTSNHSSKRTTTTQSSTPRPGHAAQAAQVSQPLHAAPSSTTPTASTNPSATFARTDSRYAPIISKSTSASPHDGDAPGAVKLDSAMNLLLHHLDQAWEALPHPRPTVRLLAGNHGRDFWNGLPPPYRDQWETLHIRISQDHGLRSGAEQAKDLIAQQDLMSKITSFGPTKGTWPSSGVSEAKQRGAADATHTPRGPTRNASVGSSGRRSADCYRPRR